jgi:hypothetical protein
MFHLVTRSALRLDSFSKRELDPFTRFRHSRPRLDHDSLLHLKQTHTTTNPNKMSTPKLDLKKAAEPAPDAAAADVKEEKLSGDALTKYQTASTLLAEVLKKFIPTIVEGKSVLELCNE